MKPAKISSSIIVVIITVSLVMIYFIITKINYTHPVTLIFQAILLVCYLCLIDIVHLSGVG